MTENSNPAETVESVTQHRSLWGDVWRQFRKHKGAMTGVIVFIFITLIVSIGPLIHDIEPSAINFRERNLGPTLAHPLGTDNIGHDTLAQILAGGQVSLAVGFLAMLIALFLGTFV
jgi:peptide/nickel transport system permease protein